MMNPVPFGAPLEHCVACGAGSVQIWGSKRENGTVFSIFRCPQCSIGFMNPRPSFEYLMNSIYSSTGHGLIQPLPMRMLESLKSGITIQVWATLAGSRNSRGR